MKSPKRYFFFFFLPSLRRKISMREDKEGSGLTHVKALSRVGLNINIEVLVPGKLD